MIDSACWISTRTTFNIKDQTGGCHNIVTIQDMNEQSVPWGQQQQHPPRGNTTQSRKQCHQLRLLLCPHRNHDRRRNRSTDLPRLPTILLVVAVVLVIIPWNGCHGFLIDRIQTFSSLASCFRERRHSLAIRHRNGSKVSQHRRRLGRYGGGGSSCRSATPQPQNDDLDTLPSIAEHTHYGAKDFTSGDGTTGVPRRRQFITTLCSSALAFSSTTSLFSFPDATRAVASQEQAEASKPEPAAARIVRLSSGLQFSDQRIGSGPSLPITSSSSSGTFTPTNNKDNSNREGLEPDDPRIVLMHLKALRRDGSVLLDTYETNKPLLFRLGSIPSEMYYLNEGGALSKGKITLGVQDAILAQGAASWEGGFGKAEPMRYGGIRKVVVPAELAYGTKGVSRYEALKLGLKQPVARDEILRYEIEILRCNDEIIDLKGSNGDGDSPSMMKDDGTESSATAARACCPEEVYPCQL